MPSALPQVVIRSKRARPFFARHPWAFANSIERVDGDPEPGAEVRVVSREGQFIARGLFNPHSAIRVRLYRWDDAPIDPPFLLGLIDRALDHRVGLPGLDLLASDSAARLVFSEGDGISGLTADRFGRYLSVQITSLALDRWRDVLVDHLVTRTEAAGVILRGEKGVPAQEKLRVEEGWIRGTAPDGPIAIRDGGVGYEVDLAAGQKTGFYLDQRDNRRVVAAYARGRRVLDLCCYTGGFALASLVLGGATAAVGVDASRTAIDLARRNAKHNEVADRADFETSDVFEALDRRRAEGERFGLVVCDPPKFAPNARTVDDALKGYLRLNRAALHLLEPGGILATCSCSGLVSGEMFAQVLGQVAELSGRSIQLLDRRGQAPDHPVSASCLETDYLKCFIARVV